MEVYVRTLPDELVLPPPYITKSPPQYFQNPTVMAAVGPRGSGKTYSLMLFNKWMFDNEYFTRFYVISPTYESNPPLATVATRPNDIYTVVERSVESLADVERKTIQEFQWYDKITNEYTEKYQEYLNVDRDISKLERETLSYLRATQQEIDDWYNELEEVSKTFEGVRSKAIDYTLKHRPMAPNKSLDTVLGYMFDDMHPWFHPPPKMKKPIPLLFIDDCSHSPIYSTSLNNPLINLCLRHRHVGGPGNGISLQFAVQTFKTGVPKSLRQNVMQFLIFKTNDIGTIEDIYEELGAFVTKENFIDVYHKAIKSPHDFLLIDTNTKKTERRFRRGWDTFLIFIDKNDIGNEEDDKNNRKRKDIEGGEDKINKKRKDNEEENINYNRKRKRNSKN